MMPATSQLDALHTQLPPERFSTRDGLPVCSPETTEEVAIITSFADRNSLTIEIVGSGTKHGWGNPATTDILLDTTRLNRVLEHTWQDLTCTVQAGSTWNNMQQALARHNQFVALDPLWPTRATVGGIVATNDSGALRHRYGSLRDLIIGMTIVLADGTIARSGGKVVKNVAGYDLHKLMCGAFGTLGVITEVTFRLHPLPLHEQNFTVSAAQAAQLAPLIAAIRDSHLLTQALQLRSNSQGFHLDMQLNAKPEARQSDVLATMTKAFGLLLTESTSEDWKTREALFNDQLTLKATMLPDQVASLAQEVSEKNGRCIAQCFGIMLAGFPCDNEISAKLIEEFRYHVGLQSGATELLKTLPQFSGFERDAYRTEDQNSSALPFMLEIKRQFDPNRTLNPGRFFGGI
jgi:glycolate oxidase FAD binding subunit